MPTSAHEPRSSKTQGCTGDCHQCGVVPDNPDAPLRGIRLTAVSFVAFLLPLAAAILGGLVQRSSPSSCFVGVLSGLVLGAGAAWLVNRGLYPKDLGSHNATEAASQVATPGGPEDVDANADGPRVGPGRSLPLVGSPSDEFRNQDSTH